MMEKNRQTKVIAIIALVVAVVGMSLGFAAFSNILTISSSATVTPNSEDFKMVAYGLGTDIDGNVFMEDFTNLDYYTSKTSGRPILGGTFNDSKAPLGGETAVISKSGDQISISNIVANYSEPDQSIIYPFVIKNEGAYDAYLTMEGFDGIPVSCTPGTGTTPSLVESACESMSLNLMIVNPSTEDYYEGDGSEAFSSKIAVGEYIVVMPFLWYTDGPSARADGEFIVQFDNITMNFSSAA